MLQLVVSALVLVAGLYVALAGGIPSGLRAFGWLLAVIGLLGAVAAVLLRRRGRRPPV